MTRRQSSYLLLPLIALILSSLACGPTQFSQGDVDAAVTETMAAIQTENAGQDPGGEENPVGVATTAPPPSITPTPEPAPDTP